MIESEWLEIEPEWLLIQKVDGEWPDQLIHDLDLSWRTGWKGGDFENAEWEEARLRIIAALDELHRRSSEHQHPSTR